MKVIFINYAELTRVTGDQFWSNVEGMENPGEVSVILRTCWALKIKKKNLRQISLTLLEVFEPANLHHSH